MALDLCERLGFTLTNTPGVHDIKPQALGMRGLEVDFDAIETGDRRGDVKLKTRDRVRLERAPKDVTQSIVPSNSQSKGDKEAEFIKLDVGQGQDFEALNYNHKLRRKLRRALDHAQIQKEGLIRERALQFFQARDIDPPSALKTNPKPHNIKGVRTLDNGNLETAKQERIRARVELAEFNQASRVLRRQAKQCAIESGLRKHAQLIGRLPASNSSGEYLLPAHISASATNVCASTENSRAESSVGTGLLHRQSQPRNGEEPMSWAL